MAISHCYWHLVVKNGNFTLLLTSSGQEWQFHTATHIYWSRMAISHFYWHLAVKNSNFTLLLISSGQEWQFHIGTDIWSSIMAISHCYSHLMVKNGNKYIYPQICQQIYPQMHHGIYIMGCIWQPFWILQEKVGISFYFWIIRVVNSQLAL